MIVSSFRMRNGFTWQNQYAGFYFSVVDAMLKKVSLKMNVF
jgi:hypothetical protein